MTSIDTARCAVRNKWRIALRASIQQYGFVDRAYDHERQPPSLEGCFGFSETFLAELERMLTSSPMIYTSSVHPRDDSSSFRASILRRCKTSNPGSQGHIDQPFWGHTRLCNQHSVMSVDDASIEVPSPECLVPELQFAEPIRCCAVSPGNSTQITGKKFVVSRFDLKSPRFNVTRVGLLHPSARSGHAALWSAPPHQSFPDLFATHAQQRFSAP